MTIALPALPVKVLRAAKKEEAEVFEKREVAEGRRYCTVECASAMSLTRRRTNDRGLREKWSTLRKKQVIKWP